MAHTDASAGGLAWPALALPDVAAAEELSVPDLHAQTGKIQIRHRRRPTGKTQTRLPVPPTVQTRSSQTRLVCEALSLEGHLMVRSSCPP